jgi:hypothetical protein
MFVHPVCHCVNHVDISTPLPAGTREKLTLEAAVLSARTTWVTTDDGRIIPSDFTGVPEGESELHVRPRRANATVLKVLRLPAQNEVTPELAAYAGATGLGHVALSGGLSQRVMWRSPVAGSAWPEEQTPAYAAYRRELEAALAEYQHAHVRLVAALATNPLSH